MAAVTPTASVEEFVSAIEKSRLLSAAALAKLREAATQTTDPKRLARDLIKDDLLTKWQATQLLHTYSALIMGRYELLDDLGASGLARVYLVEHVQMKRRHALKVLSKRQTAQPEIVKQFLADAQQACQLEHPNLSRIYDVNQDGDRYYVVMEHIEGQNLDRLIAEKGKLTVAEAADFARQTAAGLAHAHEHGVIHGDLKPANLLLDTSGTIKIKEIGQAKLGGSSTADRASDVYSLGSVLCFLLTGKLPENAAAAADQLQQVADLPTEIAALVSRLMADQPANRPASLTEVQEQLARASEAEGPLLGIKIDEEEPAEKNKSGPLLVAKRLDAVAAEGPQAISGGFAIQTGNRGPKKPLTAPAAKPAAVEAKPKPAPAKAAAEVESEEVEFTEAASTQADAAPAPAAGQDQKTNTKLIVAAAIGGGGVLALSGIIALVVAFFGGSREKQVAQNKPAAVKPAVATPAQATETNPLANPEANPEVNPTVEPAAPPAAPAAEAKPAAVSAAAASSALPAPSPPPAAAAKTESDASKTEKKAETKPDAKTETKPEAKPAAKPAAAKAEPAKTPPKPEPPKAPPNPLNGFAKEVALPELPLMGEPPTDVLAPIELGPCKVDAQLPIDVRLLGGETVIRGGKQKFDLQPGGPAPARQWGFQLVGAEAPVVIATLTAQNGKLLFQWSADVAKQAAAASLLCNCALELQAGPGHITVPLRKPVLGTPLNVQMEKAGENVKWVIPSLPDAKHILVQVLRCEGLKTYRLEPLEPVVAGSDVMLWTGPDDKSQVLGLKLATSAPLRGVTITSSAPQIRVAGASRSQSFRKKEFADQLNKKGQELQLLLGQINVPTNPQADNNTKKKIDEMKALATVEAKRMQTEVDQLSQLATFISEAQSAGKIHFRVFYKASDVEVDLLYTSEDRKPAPPPAPPAEKKAAAAPATATTTTATKAADDAKAKKAADDAKAKKAAEDAKATK